MVLVGLALVASSFWPPFRFMGWPLLIGAAILLSGLAFLTDIMGGLQLTQNGIAWRGRSNWREMKWDEVSEIRIAKPRIGTLGVSPGIEIIAEDESARSSLLPETYGYSPEKLLAHINAYRAKVMARKELN